jgi:glutamate 5-kinase
VSSGAIGLGLEKLGLNKSDALSFQQATASVGQSVLMSEYSKAFDKYNQIVGQILLTHDVFGSPIQLQMFQNTLNKLMELNVVPIINENDSIAVDELKTDKGFSDNDGLAAMVAETFHADLLVILSDVDGLYTDNPKSNKNAERIPEISDFKKAREMVSGKSFFGKGGFISKIDAAEKLSKIGSATIVCTYRKNFLKEIFSEKAIGTMFK